MDVSKAVERDFLPFINKPGRFIGNEFNVVQKNPDQVTIRVALAFPEIYELGMSYVGFDMLYHILNEQPHIWAERVYAPWFDAEEQLRRHGIPLFTLESCTPLADFHWIGLTLQYELTYTTILNMLDLAGIPLRSEQRSEEHPFVIAGGPSTANPEPLSPFMDGFLIGDGEEAVLEISEIIRTGRESGTSRENILLELSRIEGMYIPSFYRAEYDSFGDFRKTVPVRPGVPEVVRKRVLPELEQKNYPTKPLVPLIEVTHDRLSLEVMRGCTEGCRFCNAGMIYRPVRERAVEDIFCQSDKAVESTGFDEISLLSLNTSDYSDLEWLMLKEKMLVSDQKLGFSFPSLRLDGLTAEMVDFVRTFKKSGFTFAPEAGSQRLRNVINKNIRESDLLESLEMVLANGWQIVKFYFMIGLPTEKQEDLDAIVELMGKCRILAAEYRDVRINIAISPFTPKPHTPFQWEKQEGPEELENKSRYLAGKLENSHMSVSWRDGTTSTLETVFTRGGREIGPVLETAWKKGARFDGWKEGFSWERWEEAFRENGIDWKKYTKPLSVSLPLPWDHIDMGISKSFLQQEKLRAYEGRLSKDCRENVCLGCGLQRKEFRELVSCYRETGDKQMVRKASEMKSSEKPVEEKSGISYGRYSRKKVNTAAPVKKKVRMRFTKTGLSRFISHLDIIRLFDRAARRAKVSLVYSQGFHPRPKLAFGPPLGLGIASIAEYMDVEVEINEDTDLLGRLNPVLPDGMKILSQKAVFSKVPSLSAAINRAVYKTESDHVDIPDELLQEFMARKEIEVSRMGKNEEKIINIRPFISKLEKKDEDIYIIVDAVEGRTARITEVLAALLADSGVDPRHLYTERTAQFIVEGDTVLDPMDVL